MQKSLCHGHRFLAVAYLTSELRRDCRSWAPPEPSGFDRPSTTAGVVFPKDLCISYPLSD